MRTRHTLNAVYKIMNVPVLKYTSNQYIFQQNHYNSENEVKHINQRTRFEYQIGYFIRSTFLCLKACTILLVFLGSLSTKSSFYSEFYGRYKVHIVALMLYSTTSKSSL